MSMLDGILRNIAGSPDDVVNLAQRVGIDPAVAERAIATLGQTHQMQGDTVELAAARTGLDASVLTQIVQQIGGEGSLSEFANAIKNDPSSLMGILDKDGDGSALDDIAGMAGKLFGRD